MRILSKAEQQKKCIQSWPSAFGTAERFGIHKLAQYREEIFGYNLTVNKLVSRRKSACGQNCQKQGRLSKVGRLPSIGGVRVRARSGDIAHRNWYDPNQRRNSQSPSSLARGTVAADCCGATRLVGCGGGRTTIFSAIEPPAKIRPKIFVGTLPGAKYL